MIKRTHNGRTETLQSALDGAHYVRFDESGTAFYVWDGEHQVTHYASKWVDQDGFEPLANIGSFRVSKYGSDGATVEEAIEGIEEVTNGELWQQ